MKRKIALLAGVASIIIYSAAVYANMNNIEAIKVNHPILVNDVLIDQTFPMISIDDRIYLPLRAVCDILNIEIEWKEEGRVEITTNEEYENDYQISENMALEIADIVFTAKFGKEFVETTDVFVESTYDAYKIYRRPSDNSILGGDGCIYIGKKDGRIINIVAGE